MKKTFLLSILLFQLTFVYGQTEYGNWTPSPCYNYIQFQMKYNGKSSVQSGTERVEQGWYSIRIRNTSPKKVALSYIVTMNSNREVLRHSSSTNTISTVRVEGGAPDTRLNPNEIIERDIYLTKTFQSVVYFEVWALKFESNNGATINELYENCSNGKPCMECQEHPNQMSCNSNSSTSKNSNQQTTQQNDLSEYNRSKADLERQIAEKNAEIQKQNLDNQRQQFNKLFNEGNSLKSEGNFGAAKNRFNDALKFATNDNERQQVQKALSQNDAESKAQIIGVVTKTTTDLITYFANRKNALRNSLSQEDGQALMEIVNSENPTDYIQNIIQIFTDLGYTYRKTDKLNGMTSITMNNDVNNINDFLSINIHLAGSSDYNSISFSYHRKEKLLQQLSALGNNLKGFKFPEIKGIPPSRQKVLDIKEIAEKQKKQLLLDVKPVISNTTIDKNIDVQTILNKHILAIGGIEKLKKVNFITTTSTSTTIGRNEESNIKTTKAYGKIIIEVIYDGVTSKKVLNDKTGYYMSNNKKTFYNNDEVLKNKKKLEPIEILRIQKNTELEVGKIMKINEQECNTIIEKFDNHIETYFFNVSTGLWIGTKIEGTGSNSSIRYEYFEDYRIINGISFPFKVKTIDPKFEQISTYLTKEIIINDPNIKDSDFE